MARPPAACFRSRSRFWPTKRPTKTKRIGGLVLEVKGDFCHKVKDILDRHQRAEDYIEISLDSEYCYNPLHNDLDAYALAYNIASLLNNLFGRGKEPFWQQAYTNLVKFIILLHKVAYDYVTFFDVYECAISPPLLEERIAEAEEIILGRHFVAVTPKVYGERTADLAGLGFVHDEKEDRFLRQPLPSCGTYCGSEAFHPKLAPSSTRPRPIPKSLRNWRP